MVINGKFLFFSSKVPLLKRGATLIGNIWYSEGATLFLTKTGPGNINILSYSTQLSRNHKC